MEAVRGSDLAIVAVGTRSTYLGRSPKYSTTGEGFDLSSLELPGVQEELLQEYPETTPVAVCYHLTWKDEQIFRGELKDLARIVKENNLTLTTMIVVGEAIGNREGLSRLYAHEFKHLYRK